MIRSTLLALLFLSLYGCRDDVQTPLPSPEPPKNDGYVEPALLIIGHRGASALRPEHTLAAYQKAIDDGADFIEPDLVMTKDGILIARHENEIGGTTNVSELAQFASRKTTKMIDGVSYTGWFSEDFSLNELQQLKARERIPDIRPDNTRFNDQFAVPTLDDIIELAAAHYEKTGKIIGLYIETKHPSYFQSINLAMEQNLLSTLAKHPYSRDIAPVYLQSFEVSNLKFMRQQLDQLQSIKHAKIIQLYAAANSQPQDAVIAKSALRYADMASKSGLQDIARYAHGVGPSKTYIIPNGSNSSTTFVADAHAAGLKVHPYTLRPENHFLADEFDCSPIPAEKCESGALKEFELFFKAGVDGVFTDDPALGRKAADAFLKP